MKFKYDVYNGLVLVFVSLLYVVNTHSLFFSFFSADMTLIKATQMFRATSKTA